MASSIYRLSFESFILFIDIIQLIDIIHRKDGNRQFLAYLRRF